MAIYYVSATGTGGKNGSAPYDTGGANGPFIASEAFGSAKTPTAGDTVFVINNGPYYFADADVICAATGSRLGPLRYIAVDTALRPVETRRPSTVLLNESNLARLVINTNRTLQLLSHVHMYGFHITTSGTTASRPAVTMVTSVLDGCKVVSTNTASSSHAITMNGNDAIITNCDVFVPQTNNMTSCINATAGRGNRIHSSIIWNNSATADTTAIGIGANCSISNSIISGRVAVTESYGLADYGNTLINNTFIGIAQEVFRKSSANNAELCLFANNIVHTTGIMFNASNAAGALPFHMSNNIISQIASTGTRASGMSVNEYALNTPLSGLFNNPNSTGVYLLPYTTGFGAGTYYGGVCGAMPPRAYIAPMGIQ